MLVSQKAASGSAELRSRSGFADEFAIRKDDTQHFSLSRTSHPDGLSCNGQILAPFQLCQLLLGMFGECTRKADSVSVGVDDFAVVKLDVFDLCIFALRGFLDLPFYAHLLAYFQLGQLVSAILGEPKPQQDWLWPCGGP